MRVEFFYHTPQCPKTQILLHNTHRITYFHECRQLAYPRTTILDLHEVEEVISEAAVKNLLKQLCQAPFYRKPEPQLPQKGKIINFPKPP